MDELELERKRLEEEQKAKEAAIPSTPSAPTAPATPSAAPEASPENNSSSLDDDFKDVINLPGAGLLKEYRKLMDERKKEMAEAEQRKFNSSIFAALGNHLPAAIAGATAMNTKANVTPVKTERITPTDSTATVHERYKPELDSLMSQYKALNDNMWKLKKRSCASYVKKLIASTLKTKIVKKFMIETIAVDETFTTPQR